MTNPQRSSIVRLHLIKSVTWRLLQITLWFLTIYSVVQLFFFSKAFTEYPQESSVYLQYIPFILFICGLIAQYKAILHEKSQTQPRIHFSVVSQARDKLCKNIAMVTIAAGLLSPVKLITLLGKLHQYKEIAYAEIFEIIVTGALLMFGILWFNSINNEKEEDEERED